jgi:hypothetical protein
VSLRLDPGSTFLVIGAGVSGLGAAKFLRAKGLAVRVSERSKLSPEKAAPWSALGVDLKDGGHDVSHLSGVQGVVLSPGLPATHPLLLEAKRLALPMVSEIDLALGSYTGRVYAVTGTNGKSTTCAMLGHLLEKAGESVEVGGNFGDPPTAMLAEGRVPDHLVLELSSYQLEQSDLVAPEVAVFATARSLDIWRQNGGFLPAYQNTDSRSSLITFSRRPRATASNRPNTASESCATAASSPRRVSRRSPSRTAFCARQRVARRQAS